MKILLVDDDAVFRALITEKLAAQGLTQLSCAHSAEEALELVEKQSKPFDCYLLDIMLGDMDGIELCRRLRERSGPRAAPIIMITSNQSTALMEQAFAAGATDFLRKPLEEVELAGRINAAMLLVETTRKVRQGRKAMRALLSHGSTFNLVDLDERVCFPNVEGMIDYYQLENRLLRLENGQYQISLLRIQIRDFRKLNKRNDRPGVMRQLLAVSTRIADIVPARRLMLSYIGRGRFICCVIGREAKVSGLFVNPHQVSACKALTDLGSDDSDALRLEVTPLSKQHILPKSKIVSLVRKEFQAVTTSPGDGLPDIAAIEDRIFAEVDEARSKVGAMRDE